MPVVEYKLHKFGKSLIVPEWMEDGGYWSNPADNTMVGWVLPESEREYYVPDTLTELSRADFITRLKTMHSVNAFQNMSDNPGDEPTNMTETEVETMAGNWYDNFHAS
jgi:hypothetical protein